MCLFASGDVQEKREKESSCALAVKDPSTPDNRTSIFFFLLRLFFLSAVALATFALPVFL